MIGILDYGMGNLFSVSSALEGLGVPFIISDNQAKLNETDAMILPGVGAFKDAMTCLEDQKHVEFIRDYAKKKPLLGICLGMQLLFEESEEHGLTKGLSLLPGRVIKFSGFSPKTGKSYKVPHMGWNTLSIKQPESCLVKGLSHHYAYFVHSYYVDTNRPEVVIATADYDVDVPAVVGDGQNVFGTQFHPEKSSECGLSILKKFIEYAALRKQTNA
ncbi:imidazole glycerol phosphate synthase subunit HisH [Terrilactibacillus laevilacticus]|uniref:Imidazole glycerol phosphate synthase subunit HisH n=1 Tax=Terrilactibacillus laevilacticus TaxID=1380157 RepID=A0ABW5PSY3_9BACI|nr:imidazole glycerol phosphate synthase subunit HisH [Terrilactibacillus laevilacticus]